MPPSPALRYSPGREPKEDGHKRGRSLESGLLFREKDEDLALFSEMQSRERESFLLQSSDDFEDSFSTKLRHFSDVNLGISIPGRGETSGLLNADGDKNDYDWLLTPPDTPLFPSLDDEPPPTNVARRGRPQSKPISISRSSTMEKSYRSSRGSASPNRLSPSPRSTNTLQSRGRPSSLPNYSPTPSLRSATPSRRPSPPPNKHMTPASKSSTYTPQRMSTGSSGSVISTGVRGTSPVKTSRGNSVSPKIRAWQTNIPGFSSEAPPNLCTSLADRPASYVRGSSPASRNSRDSTSKFSRQSMSPTASRSSSSFHSHDQDHFSSRSKGSVASSGDDDLDSLQSIPVGSLDRLSSRKGGSFSTNKTPAISRKSVRMASPNSASKRSIDSALRQMDRKTPQNMFRPLLSSVPSTTFYAGKANSAHRSLVSRNSSVTTSSNASSDRRTTFALDTEGSDHIQDVMASETDKILYPDLHEEVFAFDKIDALNTNIEHEINGESVDIQQNEARDPRTVSGPTEAEDSVYHVHIDAEGNESSETSYVRCDTSEAVSSENKAICSHCGCIYEVIDQAEKNIRLCPECNRKTTLLRVVIPETTLAVSKDFSVISTANPKEEKSLAETNQLMVASQLPQETDVGDLTFPLGERDSEESQTSCSELNHDHSENSVLPCSLMEVGRQISVNQLEIDQSGVDYKIQGTESGDQHSDHPNLNMDPVEGAGISLLLKSSSSNKGPVVQGRTFTATTISYDDLSLSRDSGNSIRSSTRPGSYSASSSVDFCSTRQTEFRVRRQLSGRKLDVDCGYDLRVKPPSPGSSFSGTSNHSHHELGLATREISGNKECGFIEEIPQVLQETQGSGNTVTDVIDASSIDSIVVEEDKFEYDDSSRVNNACSSEFSSQAAAVQSDDNLVTLTLNLEDCISYEKVEDHPNDARSVSNTETTVKAPEPSCHEKNDVQSSNVNELDDLVTTDCSAITEAEIQGENACENNTDMVNNDLPLVSNSALDDFQEPCVQNPSDDCHTASVSGFNAFESCGIEESTVTVECRGAGNTRSLTLEEATDAILFCSSIIHDIAYQAATIAMEKESPDPFEGSEPTVTLVGKPVSGNRKDSRSRPVSKRGLKSQKTRQKRVQTNVKTPSGRTENDENIDESFTHNVGLPNTVDSMKPPKLESKCNCIIM